jgi:ATP-dependent Clp protease adapter protein ClpS
MNAHHSDRPRFPSGSNPTRPRPSPSTYIHELTLPLYQVVLLRDGVNELPSIVRIVMDVTRLYKDEATLKMWEAYHHGRSVLLRTYRERAELFAELFAERGLSVTLELA